MGKSSVPSADELFGDEAYARLHTIQDHAGLVESLHARETRIATCAEAIGRPELLGVYAELVADNLAQAGLALPPSLYDGAADLFKAVCSLPFSPKSSNAKRKAREVARVAMLCEEGRLRVPKTADELREAWERAMCGEPRWSADFPSSVFRTHAVAVRGPKPERKILHRCMSPEDMPQWLERLFGLLQDECLPLELRAACGLALNDWIHPFDDGNGHTGRIIMLAVLSKRYSEPTVVFLANELVANRSATIEQFRRLRERETDAMGFCLGLLEQLVDAQTHALSKL